MIERKFQIHAQKGYVEAVLRPKKTNNIVLIGLFLLVLISMLIPIFDIFNDHLKKSLGFLITLIIFWGTAIYFSRKLLWAFRGREVFRIEENEVRHFFDYGLFKDGVKVLKPASVKIGYAEMEKPDQAYLVTKQNQDEDTPCYLVVITESEAIRSHIPTTFGYVNKLLKMLQKND